jgi:hypothetical protein
MSVMNFTYQQSRKQLDRFLGHKLLLISVASSLVALSNGTRTTHHLDLNNENVIKKVKEKQ